MGEAQRDSRLRRLLVFLGTWLLIGLLTVGVGEAVARWAFGVQPLTTESLVWKHHPRWGWFHEAGAEDSFVKPGFVQHVRINARGLRERDIPYEKPPGLYRVLVVGDSSVVSFEVPPEAVFTRVAERVLRDRGHDVQFVNGGVRGYGTDQALLFLEEEGLRYRPDLVLYKWTGNDRENNVTIHRPFRKYGKAWFALDPAGEPVLRGVPVPHYPYRVDLRVGPDGEPVEHEVDLRSAATLWLRDHVLCRSAFGAGLLKVALALPGTVRPLVEMGTYPDAEDAPEELDRGEYRFRVTAALVRRMARSAREAGADFRMISTGDPYARSVLDAAGLQPLGEARRWRSSLPEDRSIQMPFDPHWNELGHRIYGEALAEALADSGLLPAPADR